MQGNCLEGHYVHVVKMTKIRPNQGRNAETLIKEATTVQQKGHVSCRLQAVLDSKLTSQVPNPNTSGSAEDVPSVVFFLFEQ